jgi:4'-phosphopantetheinyl transferase
VRLLWQRASGPARLGPGEVHVWAARLDLPLPPGRLALLSEDERARAARFHFERDRRRFVAARALLRELVGSYLATDPAAVRFIHGPRGKPALAAPADELRFNVSHSDEIALLAFARGCELGLDVERERELPEADEIASRYFSPAERVALGRLPADERARAFFRCWTRKEAFIKATGDGLSRPLDSFDVTLAPGEPARLLRVADDPDAAGRYWLGALEPAAGFAAALVVDGVPAYADRWAWDGWEEERHGSRRSGRQGHLQGRGEPRRAVLHLAG